MRYDGSWADPGDCQGNDDLTLLILGTVLLAFAVAVSPAEQSVAQAVGFSGRRFSMADGGLISGLRSVVRAFAAPA
jgi:hypothetical protein